MITVNISGKIHKCYTRKEMAELCGKSKSAMRKLEDSGVLPKANIKIPSGSHLGGNIRLYTPELVEKIIHIFNTEVLEKYNKRPKETAVRLKKAFEEEYKNL